MYVPFDTLPEESKIWIYQSNRKFSDDEMAEIETNLKEFVENWAAHGTGLTASYLLKYNRFIILAVDQEMQMATGCSIDSLGTVMREIDQEFQLGLFDRMKASFIQDGETKTLKLQDFRLGLKNGTIPNDIEVFDFVIENINRNFEKNREREKIIFENYMFLHKNLNLSDKKQFAKYGYGHIIKEMLSA